VKRTTLILLLILVFILISGLLFYPDYDSPRVVKFLIVSQILFALSIAIFLVGKKFDFEGKHRRLFYLILVLSMVARGVMFFGAGEKTYFSDDVYRYIWDGKVNSNGINPFVYAPPDEALEHLRDSVIYPNINHPLLPTIYPPMAQNLFLIAYTIAGVVIWGFKLLAVLFELLTIAALLVWLKSMGVRRCNILLWLYSPLILIEFYLSAHVDILAMPFLVAMLLAVRRDRPGLSGIMLALMSLVKFFGLFFAPFLLMYFKGRNRVRFVLMFAVTFISLYLPYVFGSDGAFLGSLFEYLGEWQYNASIFFVFKYGFGFEWARYLVASVFVAWTGYLLFKKLDIYQKLYRMFGGYLVLTTTFFPWYFVWMFPFVLRNLSPAFLFLSGSVLLSYHVFIGYYSTGTWSVMPWLGVVSYLPFYSLLIWKAVRDRRKS